MDWTILGAALRASAMDAHEGKLPSLAIAYSFLRDNPECFSNSDEWPVGVPATPPVELIYAYYEAAA